MEEMLCKVGLVPCDSTSPEFSDATEEPALCLPSDDCILDKVVVLWVGVIVPDAASLRSPAFDHAR